MAPKRRNRQLCLVAERRLRAEMSFEWLLDDPEFQEYVYSDSEDSVSEDSTEDEDSGEEEATTT
jgi:hypothetical protein